MRRQLHCVLEGMNISCTLARVEYAVNSDIQPIWLALWMLGYKSRFDKFGIRSVALIYYLNILNNNNKTKNCHQFIRLWCLTTTRDFFPPFHNWYIPFHNHVADTYLSQIQKALAISLKQNLRKKWMKTIMIDGTGQTQSELLGSGGYCCIIECVNTRNTETFVLLSSILSFRLPILWHSSQHVWHKVHAILVKKLHVEWNTVSSNTNTITVYSILINNTPTPPHLLPELWQDQLLILKMFPLARRSWLRP